MALVLFGLYQAAVVDLWRSKLSDKNLQLTSLLSVRGGALPVGTQKGKRSDDAVEFTVAEGQYADDVGILSTSYDMTRELFWDFVQTVAAWGMNVSFKKTKLIVVCHNGTLEDMVFDECNDTVEAVDFFTYLGSLMHSSCSARPTIEARLVKATKQFFALWEPFFGRSDMRPEIKRDVYLAAVWGTLLYAAETWNLKASDARTLQVFHKDCVRRMSHVSRYRQWRQHISHRRMCARMGMPVSIGAEIRRRRMFWLGKVVRMPRFRLPRLATYCFFGESRGRLGRPCKRWADVVNDDLKAFGFAPDEDEWYNMAQSPTAWRAVVKTGNPPAVTQQLAAVSVFDVVKFFPEARAGRGLYGRWYSGRSLYTWCEEEVQGAEYDNDNVRIVFEDGLEADYDVNEARVFVESNVAVALSQFHLLTKEQLRTLATSSEFNVPVRRTWTKAELAEQIGLNVGSFKSYGDPIEASNHGSSLLKAVLDLLKQ